MSGPDNLRGIDYQISYTTYRMVTALGNESRNVSKFKIESLDDESEDLSLHYVDGHAAHIQIKKRDEAYQWSASALKPILRKFIRQGSAGDHFEFVTNAPGNADIRALKNAIEVGEGFSPELLKKFTASDLSAEDVAKVLTRTTIRTRAFSSDDDSIPGKVLRQKIRDSLVSPPYWLGGDLSDAFNAVWMYVYDCAVQARTISTAEAEAVLRQLSIYIRPQIWRQFSLPADFLPRHQTADHIRTILEATPIVILFGVGGSGKSALSAAIAQDYYNNGHPICWLSISPLTSLSDIQKTLSSSLRYFGANSISAAVGSAAGGELEYAEKVIYALRNLPIYIFIDSINSGNRSIELFIKKLVEGCRAQTVAGRLIISTTDLSPYSPTLKFATESVAKSILMPALSHEEFCEILTTQNEGFSAEELEELRSTVGGHCLSAIFLRNLLVTGNRLEIKHLKEQGAANAQKWLLSEVIRNIRLDEKTVLLGISIFDYEFDLSEALIVADESNLSPLVCLDALCDLGLVRFDGARYYVHETVQPLVYSTLTQKSRKKLHENAEEYYKHLLNERGDKTAGYPTEIIMRWGRHVEQLAHCGVYFERSKEILELTGDQLDAIWSVQRFGAPFNFIDDDEQDVQDISQKLWFLDLIARRFLQKNGSALEVCLDTFDLLFIIFLCRSRGISGDLGYVYDFRPNMAFNEQGFCCPWEHCIEFMPFPPQSQQDITKHKQHLQQMFDRGAYADKEPEQIAVLRSMLEEPIPEDAVDGEVDQLEYGGCPIFGHCCPGGAEQARACAAQEEDDCDLVG